MLSCKDAIESDEPDANQHLACLAPDQLAIDDSHKVFIQVHLKDFGSWDALQINKHIAKIDVVSIFGALFTCMDSRYVQTQALTLTKGHEVCAGPLSGIAQSIKLYGLADPVVAFSDNPVKVCCAWWLIKVLPSE